MVEGIAQAAAETHKGRAVQEEMHVHKAGEQIKRLNDVLLDMGAELREAREGKRLRWEKVSKERRMQKCWFNFLLPFRSNNIFPHECSVYNVDLFLFDTKPIIVISR